MQIKVIKKDKELANENLESSTEKEKINPKSKEKSIKEIKNNVSNWISEMRERKDLEFLKAQSFLTSS